MAVTGKLGTSDSLLGNILLGDALLNAQSVTNNVTLTQSVSIVKSLLRSLSQSLTINQSNAVTTTDVVQSLIIAQSAIKAGTFAKSTFNTLNLIQAADYSKFKPISRSNSLTIAQVVAEVKTTGVVNTLTIAQSESYQYNPHLEQEFQILTPTQVVSIGKNFNRLVTQTVSIMQSASRLKIISRSTSNTLGIYQTSIAGQLRKILNTLTISHVVVKQVYRNKSVQNSLQITHSVGLRLVLNRSVINTLVFKNEHLIADGTGGFINVPNLIFTRGGSGNQCCPIARLTTVLQSSTRAIILPNPEYNDMESLVGAVSVKRTITGGLYSYVKKNSNRKLKYRFLVNQRKSNELRKFLLDFLGNRITMINWKGEMWSGYILTDPAEIISNSRGGVCTGDLYEVNLEYQGVRVN